LQNLLSRAKWDDDGAGEDLLGVRVDAFNDPAGILVIDETGSGFGDDRQVRVSGYATSRRMASMSTSGNASVTV
jgi:hypothetical protein